METTFESLKNFENYKIMKKLLIALAFVFAAGVTSPAAAQVDCEQYSPSDTGNSGGRRSKGNGNANAGTGNSRNNSSSRSNTGNAGNSGGGRGGR